MENKIQNTGSNAGSFALALSCRHEGISVTEAEWRVAKTFPQLDDAEVKRTVRNAYQTDIGGGPPSWPNRNVSMIRALLHKDKFEQRSLGLKREMSSQKELPILSPIDVIRKLFKPEDNVCLIDNNFRARTLKLKEIEELGEYECLLGPNPMAGPSGRTKEGKESPRCLGNACEHRRYLVVEFDDLPRDSQLAVIAYLRLHLPLIMAVDSGGKSIHSWFYVENRSEDDQKEFFKIAVTLGADRALWGKVQPTRIPNATRYKDDGGRRLQKLLYLNPRIDRIHE